MGEFTRNASLTVGLTVVQVSQPISNGKRVEFSIRNVSTGGQTGYVFLSNQEQASAGAGIPLSAGQALTQSQDSGYTPWQGNITIVADGAAGSFAVFERMAV